MLFMLKRSFISCYIISMTVPLKGTTGKKRVRKKFFQTGISLVNFHPPKLNWVFLFLKILITTQVLDTTISPKSNNLHSRLPSDRQELTSTLNISIFPLSVDVFVERMAFANLSNHFDIFDTMSQVASLPNSLSIYKSIHKTVSNF